jgi:hypothetical protein
MDTALVGYKESLLEGYETLHLDPPSFKKHFRGTGGTSLEGLEILHMGLLFIERHCNPFLSFV